MTKIDYAYAHSGATLIRVNEHDRVCLTRTIHEPQPQIELGDSWHGAFNIISSDCDIRHGYNARVAGCMTISKFIFHVQKQELRELRLTDKPKSYGEYDGTDVKEHLRDEFPRTSKEASENSSNLRGSRGYTRYTYQNGYYMDEYMSKHTRYVEPDYTQYDLQKAIDWYRSDIQ